MAGPVAVVGIRVETDEQKLRRFAQEANKTQKAVDGLGGAAAKSKAPIAGAGQAAAGAARGAAGLGRAAKAAIPGVAGLGAAIKTALGPIGLLFTAAGAVTQAFGTLAKQDFAEAKVRSLGVNSQELVGRLKAVSSELQGQASVVDLTSAAYDVASAGFTDAADAANVLKAASLGATGGFSDINTVGDAATSVLNAYGLEADKAAKLVDGFIQTQNDGKIVIGEYAANIAKVAPVAAALGVPLEEVNAAVAQITAGGQGAEVTFTALKTAFAQVAAGKVGQEFKKFGVEISAASLKSDGLAGTLEKIKKSGADAGTVIKAFGTEAGPSILALLNDTEKFNKLLENQKNAQGAAAKAAFEASDTINGSLTRLQTAFTNIFSDGAELGVLLKSIFKVAAVTVEVFGVVLRNTVAPFRAIIAAVTEIGSAISSALGTDGVNIAFELEQAYRNVLGVFSQISDFIVGLGVRFGRFIGGMVSGTRDGVANVRDTLVGGFTSAFTKIQSVVQNLYNKLPAPVRFILEQAASFIGSVGSAVSSAASGVISRVTGFVAETTAAGQAATAGGQTTAGPGADAANSIQPTGGALGGKKEKDKEAERLRKLAEASAKRVQNLKDQGALAAALNEEERRTVQLNIDLRKIQENTKGLSEDQVNAEIRARVELENKRDAAREYKKELEAADKAAKAAADAQAKQAADLRKIYEGIGSSIKDGVVGAIKGAIDGTKSLRDVATDLLNNLANKLLDLAVNFALFGVGSGSGSGGGLLGGLFNFGGGKAKGGPVSAGTSYMVGEKGPELFTPSRSGTITPNNALGGGVGNITVNVDASGTNVQGDTTEQRALGEAIGSAVRQELLKQKRPGGLLA